jgi:hypothetical protein
MACRAGIDRGHAAGLAFSFTRRISSRASTGFGVTGFKKRMPSKWSLGSPE